MLDLTIKAVYPFRGIDKSQLYEGVLDYRYGSTVRQKAYQSPSLVEVAAYFERFMRRVRLEQKT